MTEVTAHVGYYVVRLVGPEGIRAHLVGKDKHCSCGGNANRPCKHIRAVAEYLREGGEPAANPDAASTIRDSKRSGSKDSLPDVCPMCGAAFKHQRNGFWRCSRDSSHYWRWRGEQNGGAIRKFLTRPHPVKRGPFYAMTEQEREAFLLQVARRMHRGGYTPHNGKEHRQ
jgi:hypothetical protein